MSKLEAQRAMRAARYDAAHSASPTRSGGPAGAEVAAKPARATRARTKSPAAVVPVDGAAEEAVTELCGHRSSIGGKSCRRPAGHTETTHRYT